MSIHHEKGPSSSSRWLPCGGSLTYDQTGEPGPEALEGTRLHDVAARYLEHKYHGKGTAPTVTEQDLEVLTPYFEFIDECIAALNDPEIYIELYCPPTDIPDFGGTIDCLLIDGDLAWVIDLKTGFKFVAAQDNEQLLCYTTLARKRFQRIKQFRQSIVQPKINFSSTVSCTNDELNEFEQRIKSVDKTDFEPGAHCEYCTGLGDCPVADRNLVQIMSYVS